MVIVLQNCVWDVELEQRYRWKHSSVYNLFALIGRKAPFTHPPDENTTTDTEMAWPWICKRKRGNRRHLVQTSGPLPLQPPEPNNNIFPNQQVFQNRNNQTMLSRIRQQVVLCKRNGGGFMCLQKGWLVNCDLAIGLYKSYSLYYLELKLSILFSIFEKDLNSVI